MRVEAPHVFGNRLGWARTYLKKAGLLHYTRWGMFQITVGRSIFSGFSCRRVVEILLTVAGRNPTHAIMGEKKSAGLPSQNFIVHCPKADRPRRYTPAEAIWGIPLGG